MNTANMTATEIKNQIKELQKANQQRERDINKKIKSFQDWNKMWKENPVITLLNKWDCMVDADKDSITTLEEYVKQNPNLRPNKYSRLDWEALIKYTKFTDPEFLEKYLSWNGEILAMEFDDRKCPCCYEYYGCDKITDAKQYGCYFECQHYCCLSCSGRISKCSICRANRKPPPAPKVSRTVVRRDDPPAPNV